MFTWVWKNLKVSVDVMDGYSLIFSPYYCDFLGGILLFVKVRNLLDSCVKQLVHVDLTSSVLECLP